MILNGFTKTADESTPVEVRKQIHLGMAHRKYTRSDGTVITIVRVQNAYRNLQWGKERGEIYAALPEDQVASLA